jgi:hypothetical protein
MTTNKFAFIRYRGIVYLIKRENSNSKEPYDVYTYDLENPVKIGTWTNDDGVKFLNDNIITHLQESMTSDELLENISSELENA